jgi:hypothetical protein
MTWLSGCLKGWLAGKASNIRTSCCCEFK